MLRQMKTRGSIIVAVALGMCGGALARAQVTPAGNDKLAFSPSGANEFAFDTGVVKGKLRAGGKSNGLSEVVHVPTSTRLDSSMGLFGHYRVFTANKRYGTAAWDWPSEPRLRRDGCVEVQWPSADDRPFELRAVYHWTAPNILDLETSVLAKTNLSSFESFLASYFAAGFTNSCVYARSNSQQWLEVPDRSYGVWQAFPRDDQAVAIIRDGRWTFPPSPVDWVIRPQLARPIGIRSCPANNLRGVVLSPASDCFAVLTPFEAESHRSMYLSLFGKDLKAGESAKATARLMIVSGQADADIVSACEVYLKEAASK
jgi:hypothetical protein